MYDDDDGKDVEQASFNLFGRRVTFLKTSDALDPNETDNIFVDSQTHVDVLSPVNFMRDCRSHDNKGHLAIMLNW